MAAPSLGQDASLSFVVGGNKIAAGKPLPQNLMYGFNDFYGISLTVYDLTNSLIDKYFFQHTSKKIHPFDLICQMPLLPW